MKKRKTKEEKDFPELRKLLKKMSPKKTKEEEAAFQVKFAKLCEISKRIDQLALQIKHCPIDQCPGIIEENNALGQELMLSITEEKMSGEEFREGLKSYDEELAALQEAKPAMEKIKAAKGKYLTDDEAKLVEILVDLAEWLLQDEICEILDNLHPWLKDEKFCNKSNDDTVPLIETARAKILVQQLEEQKPIIESTKADFKKAAFSNSKS